MVAKTVSPPEKVARSGATFFTIVLCCQKVLEWERITTGTG